MTGVQLLTKYFTDLSPDQLEAFERLESVYREWNEQINVVSRKDIDLLYERHILHSLSIAKTFDFKPDTTILDVGTGGGFPGIPLSIFFPACHFHLVDSIGKKIKVVNEISQTLNLKNVIGEKVRAEQVTRKYDFVMSRAVTRLKPFLQWIKGSINEISLNDRPNGVIALKGGDLAQELSEVKRNYELINISDYFDEEFFSSKKIVYLPM